MKLEAIFITSVFVRRLHAHQTGARLHANDNNKRPILNHPFLTSDAIFTNRRELYILSVILVLIYHYANEKILTSESGIDVGFLWYPDQSTTES